MPPPIYTLDWLEAWCFLPAVGLSVRLSVCLSVCLFVCLFVSLHSFVIKFMNTRFWKWVNQIGTKGPRKKEHEGWNYQLSGSAGQRSVHGAEIGHKNLFRPETSKSPTDFNQNWQAHITVNAHCVATTGMQKVKGQNHTRPKIDLESWRRHHSRPPWASNFSSSKSSRKWQRALSLYYVVMYNVLS